MPDPVETLSFKVASCDAGQRLDLWLAGQLPQWSRSRIQQLIRQGCVEGGGRTDWRPRDPVSTETELRVSIPAAEPVTMAGEDIALDILYEDSCLIVINKPAGLVVHPAPGHAAGTLVNALLHHCKDLQGVGGELRPGIVHRLDKDTSGVMVAAKNQQSMDALASQFQNRQVCKSYLAVVAGIPNPLAGRIETTIGRSRIHRKKMAVESPAGKHAVTTYRVEEVLSGFSLVRLHIETGRTHQIRVHMAHVGCPVAGDAVYSGRHRRLWQDMESCCRQMLHAESLAFKHPVSGEFLRSSAPLPPDMSRFIGSLRTSCHAAAF